MVWWPGGWRGGVQGQALVAALLTLRSVDASEPGADPLTVIAASSARPVVCGTPSRLWARARRPQQARLCDLLLRASARLYEDAEQARALAAEAAEVAPRHAEPQVLLGRALQLLGQYEKAATHFAAAEQFDRTALEAPVALLAAARVEVHVGNYASALARYRRLIPRSKLLADSREEQRALLEAAVVAQFVSAESLGEARAYAGEARRRGGIHYVDLSRAALALALHRQGRREEARAVARDVGGPWAISWMFDREKEVRGAEGEITPVWPAGEREALIAVLTDAVAGELARQAWHEYLDAVPPNVPAHLLEHARREAYDDGDAGGQVPEDSGNDDP